MKLNTSVRWSKEAFRMANDLAHYLGVSRSAVMEMAIRKFHQITTQKQMKKTK